MYQFMPPNEVLRITMQTRCFEVHVCRGSIAHAWSKELEEVITSAVLHRDSFSLMRLATTKLRAMQFSDACIIFTSTD